MSLFFLFWKTARQQLRRPGPYLALAIILLSTGPVLIWNSQHGWITVKHVSENAALEKHWTPTARFFFEFVGAEIGLLNPIIAGFATLAFVRIWKGRHENPFLLFFLCMSAPVLLGHLLYTLHSRVQPNWIAPAVIPMLIAAVVYWERRWQSSFKGNGWLIAAIFVGGIPIILLHDTNIVAKLTGHPLPPKADPLRRVRAWHETASVVGHERKAFLSDGRDVFIIGAHYGLVGEISFYLPEARARVKNNPMVYYISSDHPENQFYFWPGYQNRLGENAIYVVEDEPGKPPPKRLLQEFASVSDLGIRKIEYRGRVFRTLHLYACRNLRHGGTSAN